MGYLSKLYLPPDLIGRWKDLVRVGLPLIGDKFAQAREVVLTKFRLQRGEPGLSERERKKTHLFKFVTVSEIKIFCIFMIYFYLSII